MKTEKGIGCLYSILNKKSLVQPILEPINRNEKVDKGSKRFRNIQFTIFLSGLSVFAQLYLFQPLLPTVAKDFGISAGDSSWLVSSSTLGMALGLLFFAFKSDSFSRKKQILFAMVSSSILTIASVWVYSFPLLLIIGTIKGFAIAGVSSVALPYLTEEVELSVIGVAISIYLNGNTIGGMSGRILTTILDGEIGWRNAVMIIGLSSLILAIIFWKYFPQSRFFHPEKTDFALKWREMKSFISDSYMRRLYIVGFLIMGTFVSIYNYLIYKLETPPFSLSHIFMTFIFMIYIFGLLGTTIVGRLSIRFENRTLIMGALVLMTMGVILLASSFLLIVVMGLITLTLAFFASHTMASRMVVLYAKTGKSSASSLYWLFCYLGSTVLGSGTGYLLHASSWNVFVWILAGAIFVCFILSYKKYKKRT